MTRKHAQTLLPIITAYAEGKTIQHDDNAGSGQSPNWRDMTDPQFRGDPANLRIKPAPDPYAELKAAHAAGKAIEGLIGGVWLPTKKPTWTYPVETYRIKPTPKRIPMTLDDLPPVVWVRNSDGIIEMVTRIRETGHLETQSWLFKEFNDICEDYTWSPDRKTWHSFMKEVEA